MAERSRRRTPREAAHDILAAEAFAMPAPDPALRHVIGLPGDPAGIVEPHDILAAEEFAMPAPDCRLSPQQTAARTLSRWPWLLGRRRLD